MNLLFLQDIDFPSCQKPTYGVLLEIQTNVRFLGGRVMTAKEQQFIRLVRGLVDPQTTLDEIKTILCAGLPPAPEVQRPAVLPVPHEKV